ncbi:SPOR domain-containing protein [Paracidovorax wautersii]|uniref:SPOR domain-containing protein n=1 Tax=Paracidovorax wautersii TaxID=1177982 RepID=UPI0031D965D6
MLRIAFLVLLLANAGYYAWSGGMLRGWGAGPEETSEPQRLAQQIHPEILQLHVPPRPAASAAAAVASAPAALPAAPAASAAASAPSAAPAASVPDAAGAPVAPAAAAASSAIGAVGPIASTVCQQAGPFDQNQADTLRVALPAAGFTAGSWSLDFTPTSGRWMVYMGRFPDEDALARKRAELKARKVAYDRPGSALEPGLSLGRYASQEAAERALNALAAQGVRTARVVQERTGTPSEYMLRLNLPAGDAAQAARLERARPALVGRTLRPCS